MTSTYLEMASLIERLRRQFLDVVKHELENAGIRDISNVQASMFFNIGDAETSVGELTTRGCYLGSKRHLQSEEIGRRGLSHAATLAR